MKIIRSLAVLTLLFAAMPQFASQDEAAERASKRAQLLIVGTEVDFETGRLYITGRNFGIEIPAVRLNEQALAIVTFTSSTITALIPAGIAPGSYLLEVMAGETAEARDSFDAAIGSLDRVSRKQAISTDNETQSGKKITAVIPGPGLAGGGDDGQVSMSIGTRGIVTSMIAAGAVTGHEIASAAVEANHISPSAVGETHIAENAVGGKHIAENAVSGKHIADNAVGTAKIAAGAVASDKIASAAVGSTQIAANAVTSSHLAAGAVGAEDIAAGAVGTTQIAAGAVGAAHIAAGAIGPAQIASGAVSAGDIAPDSITADRIDSNAIGSAELADDAVDTAALKDDTVTSEKVSARGAKEGQVLSAKGEKVSWRDLLPAGVVLPYGGSFTPEGYLLADGSAVSRADYADLFAALGVTYGAGDGATTFNLPDLRGRGVMGAGQGNGLTNRELGSAFGEESHVLSVAEMPGHAHGATADPAGVHQHVMGYPVQFSSGTPGSEITLNGFFSRFGQHSTQPAGDHSHNVTVAATGGSQAHNTVQPSLTMNYIIKY